MTTRRYPTPFCREILKRFLLHPSSLWALLVRTTVHVGLAWSHLLSWIGHASQTKELVCSICLFVLLWSCVVIWRFAFSAKTVGVLWWLRKLIRCQRMRLHPKCEDKPCASTEDFRQLTCRAYFLLCVLRSLICANNARGFGFPFVEITHKLSNHVLLSFLSFTMFVQNIIHPYILDMFV